tara:strand:+ start:1418 stop:1840 length:423 start_codon:yes stop_codon:yes gene_type:complete
MLKESIVFVISTGALIYFISPSDEPAKPEPIKEEVQETVTPATEAPDNAWGYDDETDADGESFTFGDPMTNLDDDVAKPSVDEDDNSGRQEQSSSTQSNSRSSASDSRTVSAASPATSEKGSVDNPIVFKTNNPPDPEDD